MKEDNKAPVRATMLILILLFISLFANSQIKPYAALEYYMGYNYTYTGNFAYTQVPIVTQIRNDMQGVTGNVIFGMEYQLRNFKVDMRVETLTLHKSGLSFRPIQSDFFLSLSYDLGEFTIKYEHLCVHPYKYRNARYFEISGGYDKIGIYWKLNRK